MAANLTDDQRRKLQEIESRHRHWHHGHGRGSQESPAAEPSASP
jgi:hypothetical protein